MLVSESYVLLYYEFFLYVIYQSNMFKSSKPKC